MDAGRAWIVDAYDCDPARLRSEATLRAVFERAVADLTLHPVAPPTWHRFPGPGGITGFLLLSESHLSVHTFPERGYAAFDLYCCRPRVDWPWAERLRDLIGAGRVTVRRVGRGRAVGRLAPAVVLEVAPARRRVGRVGGGGKGRRP